MSHAQLRQNAQFLMQNFVQYAYCYMLNIVLQYRQDQTIPTHPDRLPGSDVIVSSDDDLDDMLDFWYTAAYASNQGQDNDGLDGLTEEEIERGDQWIFDVVEG